MIKVMFEVFKNYSSGTKITEDSPKVPEKIKEIVNDDKKYIKNKNLSKIRKLIEKYKTVILGSSTVILFLTNINSSISEGKISKSLKDKEKKLNEKIIQIATLSDATEQKDFTISELKNKLKNFVKSKTTDNIPSFEPSLTEPSTPKEDLSISINKKSKIKDIPSLVENLSKNFINSDRKEVENTWNGLIMLNREENEIFKSNILEVCVRTLKTLQNSSKDKKYRHEKIKFIQSKIGLIYVEKIIDEFTKKVAELNVNKNYLNPLVKIFQDMKSIEIMTVDSKNNVIRKHIKMSDNEPENEIINEQIISSLNIEGSPVSKLETNKRELIKKFLEEKNTKVKEEIKKNNITRIKNQIAKDCDKYFEFVSTIDDKYLDQIVIHDQTLLKDEEKSKQRDILEQVLKLIKEDIEEGVFKYNNVIKGRIFGLVNRIKKMQNESFIKDAAKKLNKIENQEWPMVKIIKEGVVQNPKTKKKEYKLSKIIDDIGNIIQPNFIKKDKLKQIEIDKKFHIFEQQEAMIYGVLLETINMLKEQKDKDEVKNLKSKILENLIKEKYSGDLIAKIKGTDKEKKKAILNLITTATDFLYNIIACQNEDSFQKNKKIMLDVSESLKSMISENQILNDMIKQFEEKQK